MKVIKNIIWLLINVTLFITWLLVFLLGTLKVNLGESNCINLDQEEIYKK